VQHDALAFWLEQVQVSSGFAVAGEGSGGLGVKEGVLNCKAVAAAAFQSTHAGGVGSEGSSEGSESGDAWEEDSMTELEGSEGSTDSSSVEDGDEEGREEGSSSAPLVECSSSAVEARVGASRDWYECACSFAAAAWDGGRLLQRLLLVSTSGAQGQGCGTAGDRGDLQLRVVQGVASAVQGGLSLVVGMWGEGSNDALSTGTLSEACALWAERAAEAVGVLTHAPMLQQVLIGACLDARQLPHQSSSKQQAQHQTSPHWCCWSYEAADAPSPSLRAVRLAFSTHLALTLPPTQLLHASSIASSPSPAASATTSPAALPRTWLLVELLCAEQEQQQQQQQQHAVSDGAGVSAACAALVGGLLAGLASKAPGSLLVLQQAIATLVHASKHPPSAAQHHRHCSLLATLALQRLLAQVAASITTRTTLTSSSSRKNLAASSLSTPDAAVSLLEQACAEYFLPLLVPSSPASPLNVSCVPCTSLCFFLPPVSQCAEHCLTSGCQLGTTPLTLSFADYVTNRTLDQQLRLFFKSS